MTDEPIRDDAAMTGSLMSRGDVLKKGAVAAAAVTAAGLVGKPSSVFGAPFIKKSRYKIAIVPKALNNPVFNTANWGGATRAMELGNVDFKFTGSVQSDAAVQARVVDGLI